MSNKPGWTVAKQSADGGKPYLARAWDPNARKYRSKRYETLGQANAWAKAESARQRTGITQAGRAPIQDVIDDYLEELKRTNRAPLHQIEQKRILAAAVASGVTDLRHPRVAHHAKEWLANAKTVHKNRKGRPLSAPTMNRYLEALRTIGNLAVSQRRVYFNPFLEVESVPEPDKLKPVFTIEEITQLVDPTHAGRDYWLLFVLMMYTGCRLGEMLHLRWEWIDFKAMRIYVRDWRGIPGANDAYRLKFKKERTIPLQPELKVYLKKIAQHQGWLVKDVLRYSSTSGHRSRFATYVQKVLGGRRDADGRNIDVVAERTPHSARHCYISLMLASGENETMVQLIAGHEELSTTARYGRTQVLYRHAVRKWKPGIFRLMPRKKARKIKPELVETSGSGIVRVAAEKIA